MIALRGANMPLESVYLLHIQYHVLHDFIGRSKIKHGKIADILIDNLFDLLLLPAVLPFRSIKVCGCRNKRLQFWDF